MIEEKAKENDNWMKCHELNLCLSAVKVAIERLARKFPSERISIEVGYPDRRFRRRHRRVDRHGEKWLIAHRNGWEKRHENIEDAIRDMVNDDV